MDFSSFGAFAPQFRSQERQPSVDTQPIPLRNLFSALVAASGEIRNARKDASNPAFRSSYATLESVMGEIKPVFSRHGLAIVQLPGGIVDRAGKLCVTLTTLVIHTSGEQIGHVAEAPLGDKATAQAYGSVVTYLRRYAAQSVAGIAPTDDDDGNAASGHPPSSRPPAAAPSSPSAPSAGEVEALLARIAQIPDLATYAVTRGEVQAAMADLDEGGQKAIAKAMSTRRAQLAGK